MDIVVYILVAVIVVQDVLHRYERRDLYNRIMCKGINEYNGIRDKPEPRALSAHERVLKKWRKTGGDS